MNETIAASHDTDGPLARAQGCLLGQLAGDALGSMVEFQDAAQIRALYPEGLRAIGPSPVFDTLAGQPTDDSELALALARTLVARGEFGDEATAAAYVDWLESNPFDIGNTIRTALDAMRVARSRGQMANAGRAAANPLSEANGALMRHSPFGIWGYALEPGALIACVRRDTTLTHPSEVCQDASAAYVTALATTVREGPDAETIYAAAIDWDAHYGHSPSVTSALAAARVAPPGYDDDHSQGHVLVALQNAFYQLLHAPSLEEGLVRTVMGGGDTDTNAAVAGALLGAAYGLAAIPQGWREAVLTCRPAEGLAGVRRPRPALYWPIDALELAHALLDSGAQHARERQERVIAGAVPRPPLTLPPPAAPAPRRPRALHLVGSETAPAAGRFRAALLAGAMGDALGRPGEGSRFPIFDPARRRITDYRRWHGWQDGPTGTVTDHTQLTICVAESLAETGWLDPKDLARRLVDWLSVGRGKGEATVAAVTRLQAGLPWYLAGEDSAGNGAAVRAAPIGLLRWNDPVRLRHEAVLSALPTHRHPMGVAGAVAMAAAVAWLLAQRPGAWGAEAFVAAVQQAIAGLEPGPFAERRAAGVPTALHDRLGELPALLESPPEEALSYLRNGAFVLESVPAAFYCFLRSPDDLEETLLLAANAAYDADTVASMAGTLGGALGGEETLPTRLLTELEYRDRLSALGDRLHALAVPDDAEHGH